MRTFLLIITIIVATFSYSQNYETIYETNLTQKQQFLNLLSWSTQNQVFIKDKEIISKDLNSGSLITKFNAFKFSDFIIYKITLTLKADIRDKKYRLSIGDPIISISPRDSDLKNESPSNLNKIINLLEMIVAISEQLNNMAEWQYIEVIQLRDLKQNKLTELNNSKVTISDKKDQRRINNSIKNTENQLNYLNDVIDIIENLIIEVYDDIYKSANIIDDF